MNEQALSPEAERAIVNRLSEKITDDAIQRTKKKKKKKGYDTDGYGYQFIVDRFNDILGLQWGFDYNTVHVREGCYNNGKPYFDITVDVSIWVVNRENVRHCAGGHISATYADALKGAITNGFKKTAAFWGVGRDAYAGTLDDDNQPLPDKHENMERPAPAEDLTAKLNALPDNVKQGARHLNLTRNQVIGICVRLKWDHEAINAELNRWLTRGRRDASNQ